MNGDSTAERRRLNPEDSMDQEKIIDERPFGQKWLGVWTNGYILQAARLFLGFVFVVASIDKVADPNAFAVSIGYYKLVGPTFSLAIATILPWVELLCGLFLIFGVMIRGSSLLIVLMLLVFTAGIMSGIFRGLDISCGCFSRDPFVGRIGWVKVLENSGLILLGLLVFLSHSQRLLIHQPHKETS